MNLELFGKNFRVKSLQRKSASFYVALDSYGHNFPEEADGVLDCGSIALTCRFNRWGSLLAVGCNDGRVMIFDFTTRGIAKVLSAHVQPVCSLRQINFFVSKTHFLLSVCLLFYCNVLSVYTDL